MKRSELRPFVVLLTPDDHDHLRAASDALALPMTGLVRMLIRQHIAGTDRQGTP